MSEETRKNLPNSAIVIDDDQLITRLTTKLLNEAGVRYVDSFTDGEEAWAAMEKKQYDFICLDWKLPGLSGLALFNRLRASRNYAGTPVLVISGFLHKEDFKILSEFSCSSLLEKPFAKPQFEHHMNLLLDKLEWRENNVKSFKKVMKEFDKSPKKAMKEIQQLIADAPDPMMQVVNAARALRGKEKLDDAENLLRQALDKDPKSVVVLTELGKVLHLMHRHKDAARVLQAANFISPENMERLLLLGEVKLNEINPNDAKSFFDKALQIDGKSKKAKAGVKSAANMESYLEDHTLDAVPRSFASLLNTMAISKVRSGNRKEGIDQYLSALSFLHEAGVVARVYFNLGLAYLRDKDDSNAKKWFKRSVDKGGADFKKSAHYLKMLEVKELQGGGNSLDYTITPNAGGGKAATSVELMDCADGDVPLNVQDNVEYMEADILEGDLKLTESVADDFEEDDDFEDAVAYI